MFTRELLRNERKVLGCYDATITTSDPFPDREYLVLSYEVSELWRNDAPEHFFTPSVGATDDFRWENRAQRELHFASRAIAHGDSQPRSRAQRCSACATAMRSPPRRRH